MDFGLVLPTMPDGASPEGILAAAETADRLGWGSIWVSDHVMVPEAGRAEFGTIYEAITTLAFVAGRLPDLHLGTSVLVVPQRDAVMLAKELATLDALSGGRLVVGVGVGNDSAEYENLGKGDRFSRRGAYLDETIRLWRHLFSGSDEPFAGSFHKLTDFTFGPLPVARERLPILVGGKSTWAFARAAMLGDGYHSGQIGPEEFARRAEAVTAIASAAGRPRPHLSARVGVRFEPRSESGRYRLAGSPEEMVRDVEAFGAAGCQQLVVAFGRTEPMDIAAAVERFHASVVLPVRERGLTVVGRIPAVAGATR